MREDSHRRRIRIVIRRHVNRLHRRDRAGARRRDALLQHTHFFAEVGLITYRRRHPPQQRRHLRARQRITEDIVDKDKHITTLITEVLGHRQARESHAQTHAGRLVHLPKDHRQLVEHVRFLHLMIKVSAFTRALANAGENRQAIMLRGDRIDQFLNRHGLADAGATEDAGLAALGHRRDQINHFHARLKDLDRRRLIFK